MKKRFAIIAIVLAFISFGCSQTVDQTWDVLSLGLPAKISPEIYDINMGLYILKQTHEPLFRNDTDGRFYSNLLGKWSRDPSFSHFHMCLKPGLQFYDDVSFDIDFFKTYVLNVLSKEKIKVASVKQNSECLDFSLASHKKDLFLVFSSFKNAPSVAGPIKNVEVGLGQFAVEQFGSSRIILKRKKTISGKFNRIAFHEYKGKDDPNLKRKNIEDFNRVYISEVPNWVKNSFSSYKVPLLQSINLVVNVPDSKVRDLVFHCIDIKELRSIFMPNQREFHDLGNFLPIGVPGASKKTVAKNCPKLTKNRKSNDLVFLDWKGIDKKKFENLFAKFEQKTGLRVRQKVSSEKELIETVFQSPHPYQLYIVALDSNEQRSNAFLAPFLREKGKLIDFSIDDSEHFKNDIEGLELSSERIGALVDRVVESRVVVPLYQEVRDFYYPKNIRGIEFSKNFLQYPEVAEISL